MRSPRRAAAPEASVPAAHTGQSLRGLVPDAFSP